MSTYQDAVFLGEKQIFAGRSDEVVAWLKYDSNASEYGYLLEIHIGYTNQIMPADDYLSWKKKTWMREIVEEAIKGSGTPKAESSKAVAKILTILERF